MIFAKAQVSSERNSISPASALDKPKARPRSSALVTRTGLLEFDFRIWDLPQSSPCQINLAHRRPLRFLLERVKTTMVPILPVA
jgi:hypothetical protein